MAVLIEAVSFIAYAPNGSVCADDYLVRIGFMGPDSTSEFIQHCLAQGLPNASRIGAPWTS